jgi:hypothetical protein
MDMCCVVIALRDFGLALTPLAGQCNLVVGAIAPVDGKHPAVVADIPGGELRVPERMPTRRIQPACGSKVTPHHQGVFPPLVAPHFPLFDVGDLPVMGDIAAMSITVDFMMCSPDIGRRCAIALPEPITTGRRPGDDGGYVRIVSRDCQQSPRAWHRRQSPCPVNLYQSGTLN